MQGLENSGVPFYLQIAERLRELISSLRVGERLPSEPQLARHFRVSRFTVAKAVEQLVRDGLIVRRQGRGTFVSPTPLRRQPGYLLSFTEAVEATGHRASHKLLAYEPIAWQPGFPYGEKDELWLFDRLRFIDRVPVARHRSILPVSLVEGVGLTLEKASVEDFSLYRHFESCGLAAMTAREHLVARLATVEEQRLLSLTTRAVVVSVWRETYTGDGKAIDAVSAIYDARRYSYDARLSRRAWEDLKIEERTIEREDQNVVQTHRDGSAHLGPSLDLWKGGFCGR